MSDGLWIFASGCACVSAYVTHFVRLWKILPDENLHVGQLENFIDRNDQIMPAIRLT